MNVFWQWIILFVPHRLYTDVLPYCGWSVCCASLFNCSCCSKIPAWVLDCKATVCGKGLDVKDSQIFSDVNSIPTHELHLLQLPLEMRDNSLVKVSSNVMVLFCHQQRERLVTNQKLASICHSYYTVYVSDTHDKVYGHSDPIPSSNENLVLPVSQTDMALFRGIFKR